MALTDGLISVWHMNNNWQDAIGTNHGTAYGATFSTSAKLGNYAGSFDGIDDYISIPSTNFNIAGYLSIAAWVYADVNNLFRQWIFSHYNDLSGSFDLVAFDPDGAAPYNNIFAAQFKDANGWHSVLGQTLFAPGAWYYIVFTYDGSKLRLYLNGLPDDIEGTNYVGNIPSINIPSKIGNINDTQNFYWDGLIDEVAIWNRALTANEISELWNNGAGMELGLELALKYTQLERRTRGIARGILTGV